MVWDLRAALLRKEEFETSRLIDFEFREIVRALRLLAFDQSAEPRPLLHELADHGIDAALALLAGQSGMTEAEAHRRYMQARAEARQQLIRERGDPSPVRLG